MIELKPTSVNLVDHMLQPLATSIVRAARVSYESQSDDLGDRDWRLIKYLDKHGHTSPFRHSYLSFEIEAPIFVLRQWMKHTIGCAWNERSGRYTEFAHSFWEPMVWRSQDTKNKQGSIEPLSPDVQAELSRLYCDQVEAAFDCYSKMLELGAARELARVVMPVATMSKCVWTCSLQALIHFLKQRLDPHAQAEIRVAAEGVRALVEAQSDDSEKLITALLGGV